MNCTMLVTATFVKISATAINPAEWSKADGQSDSQWYDLQGRRVMQPQKGIYIKDGKKVVLR